MILPGGSGNPFLDILRQGMPTQDLPWSAMQMPPTTAPVSRAAVVEQDNKNLRERIKQLEAELAQAKRPQVCDICRGLMDVEKAVAAEMAPAQESKAPDPDDDVPF